MVLPFRRKDKDKGQTVNDEDEDINALLNSESHESSKSTEVLPEPTTDEERLHAISDMVVQTCMDIRRGENVLIVCDPTTARNRPVHFISLRRSAQNVCFLSSCPDLVIMARSHLLQLLH